MNAKDQYNIELQSTQDQCIWDAEEAAEAESKWLSSIRYKLKRKGLKDESITSDDS